MNALLLGSLAGTLLGWLMGFLSLFLIMLILIQRGKGGGLTGALGGPGGQSAFGSKAGDTFTVITVVVASVWAFTCAFTMWLLGTHAPTTITDSTITAGPGDADADETVPPLGGSASDLGPDQPTGLDGIGAAPADITEGVEAIESIELTPAQSDGQADADAEEAPASDAAAEEAPASDEAKSE